jgi:protein tyrosine phosphatase (PTP) superfamily phosphohydrolase (DUF442 family)
MMRIIHVINGFVLNSYSGIAIEDLEAALGGMGGEFIETEIDVKAGDAWPIVPPPPPEISPSITKSDVITWAESKLQDAIKEIPPTEQSTWPDQIAEAALVLSGGTAPTPFISSQCAISGESIEDLALKIQAKAGELLAYSGVIVGIRRKYLSLIDNGLTEPVFIGSLDLELQQALGD